MRLEAVEKVRSGFEKCKWLIWMELQISGLKKASPKRPKKGPKEAPNRPRKAPKGTPLRPQRGPGWTEAGREDRGWKIEDSAATNGANRPTFDVQGSTFKAVWSMGPPLAMMRARRRLWPTVALPGNKIAWLIDEVKK